MLDGTRFIQRAAVLAGVLALVGCAKEPVGGGIDHGEVRAYATSSENGGAASAVASRAPSSPSFAAADVSSPVVQGSLTMTSRVLLVTPAGAEVPLTPGFVSTQFQMGDTVAVASGLVPAGTYDRVRVAYTEIHADVTGGLVIDGLPILGRVDVVTGAAPLVVERAVEVNVARDGVQRVLLDLRAAAWLAAMDPIGRTVSAEAFRQAVRVDVSSGD